MTTTSTHRSPLILLAALCALILLLLALLSVGAPVLAGIETTLNLPRSGQTTCYDVDGSVVPCSGCIYLEVSMMRCFRSFSKTFCRRARSVSSRVSVMRL